MLASWASAISRKVEVGVTCLYCLTLCLLCLSPAPAAVAAALLLLPLLLLQKLLFLPTAD
jgi:hypothetical protein